MSAHWTDGLGIDRTLDLADAMRMLAKVASAFVEVCDGINDYDEEHPDLWGTCSEHPGSPPPCGSRDLPSFWVTALVTRCDATDALSMVKAWQS